MIVGTHLYEYRKDGWRLIRSSDETVRDIGFICKDTESDVFYFMNLFYKLYGSWTHIWQGEDKHIIYVELSIPEKYLYDVVYNINTKIKSRRVNIY